MKITKQRLKEIIREELTAEGSREDMMMPALSQADFDAAKKSKIILDTTYTSCILVS
jgi:hypothetical protein